MFFPETPNRALIIGYTVVLLGFAWLITMDRASARSTGDPQVHREFDAVLYPAFVAASNDYAFRHPSKPEHEKTFDVGDASRFESLRRAFRALDDAARKMGY